MIYSRPRFRTFFLAIVFFAVTVIPCVAQTSAATYTIQRQAANEKMEREVLNMINKYREGKGLAILQNDDNFSTEALRHSKEMADQKTSFGHDGFEGRVKRLGQQVAPLRMSAENVAYGQLSANEVVANWLKRPGHRKNIEGNYSMTGIGIFEARDGTLFFTQIFGAR